jgi:hypothetical protein
MVRTIDTEGISIRVEVFEEPGAKKTDPKCGCIQTNLHGHGDETTIDSLENLILNHACAGINIETEAYVRGVVDTVTALRQANDYTKALDKGEEQ